MAKELPSRTTKQLLQYNKSDILGDLESSFNLDLTSNEGAIRTTRMKGALTGTFASLGLFVGFENYDGELYAISNKLYKGGRTGSETWSAVASSPSFVEETTDIKNFNNALYLTRKTKGETSTLYIDKYDGSWSVADSKASVLDGSCLLETYADNLYISAEGNKVWSLNTSDVLSTTGTATLDLGLSLDWVITSLNAGTDRLWISLTNISSGKGLVYEWNGQSENDPSTSYSLDEGVLSGVIKDNRLHVITNTGRLLVFNGGSFTELSRLPLYGMTLENMDSRLNERWIVSNGMTTDGENILINIGNAPESFNIETPYRLPSGVWEYSTNTGLYHKYSYSLSSTSDTTFSDYGQFASSRSDISGGIYFHKSRGIYSYDNNGQVISGARLKEYPSIGTSNTGIFTDDTIDTTPKWGYLVTTKIMSDGISDKWQKFYTVYKELLDSTDKIVVKYKTKEDIPTQIDLTWVDTESFTTTDDISDYEIGNEVQIISGTGSGKSAHITSISENSGTYTVVLDDTFTGATGSAEAFLEKWIKLGEITQGNNTKEQFMGHTIAQDNISPWIKFKVSIGFTGQGEIYKFRIINKTTVNE